LRRAGVDGEKVGHVVFGNVIHTEPRDMYLSRVAAIETGIGEHVPALTLNRLCGSGLQAVISAAQSVLLGDCDLASTPSACMATTNTASTAVQEVKPQARAPFYQEQQEQCR
jgi:acetyl-CoA acetyltransferase